VAPEVREGPSRAGHLAELLGQVVTRIRRLGLLGPAPEAPELSAPEPAAAAVRTWIGGPA
jgi:hypothetical protein